LARRILVMYTGLVVEEAGADDLFTRPAHPYTTGLLKALPPALDEPAPAGLTAIAGAPPAPGAWPPGCPFEPRCPEAGAPCREALPPLADLGGGRRVRCFPRANGAAA
ncbi:MAG: ABC transporter ATP-binding protein, partial [Candidatus Adiutrix sp.]|nr:ABC transporter ATP-binding protein [Candidatus Adiutrix sp.]